MGEGGGNGGRTWIIVFRRTGNLSMRLLSAVP